MVAVTRNWMRHLQGSALALAAAYLALGLLWIVSSDQLGQALFTSRQALTWFQTWKGAGFVAATALVLYAVLARRRAPPAAAETPRGEGPPLATQLVLLVLATALPMVAMLGWHVVRETRAQTESARRLVRSIAESTAAHTTTFFDGQVRIASALARRSALRQLDAGRCDPILMDDAVVQDPLLEVSTYDRDGRVVCGRAERRTQPPPAWLAPLVRGGRPLVSPVGRHALAGVWSFAIVHPIVDAQGAVTGAVELLVPATALLRLTNGPVPEGGAIALIDGADAVAARFPALPQYVGRPVVNGDILRRLRPVVRDGTFSAPGLDGVDRLFAAAPVGRSDWLVLAGVPAENLYAPARRAFLRTLLPGLAVIALSIWLVLRLARNITVPLLALRRTADRAATGDFSERAPEGGPAELAAVAARFNQMMERLPQLQQQVRESEQRQREMIEKLSRNLPGVIYISHMAPGGHSWFPLVSAGLRELFELDPAELAHDGKPAMDRIHPLDRSRVWREVVAAGQALRPFSIEYRVMLPRRGLRHLLTQAHPERGDDGVTVWYGAILDVSDLRHAQHALENANATLEQRIANRTAALAASNEALESFSYSVAHDLRAPLASIDGFAQGMAQALDKGDTDRALGYADRVAANAQRMNLLIEGFLALARASRAPLVDSPVDIQRLVGEVLAELPRPPAARIDVGPLPRLRADQATVRQVWQNLLSNAVKYSARRSKPLVTVGCTLPADGEGEVVFRVEDNGAGFDPEYADKLFTPFGRLHKAEEFEGTGIGLALVRRIVERHGGRIWAQSRPGKGATFYFTIPRQRLL